MPLANGPVFSRLPRAPFNAALPEGQAQERPPAKLQAYLNLDALLQSLDNVDNVFANAPQAARDDARKVIDAKTFGGVRGKVEEAIAEYIASLDNDNATLAEWQVIASFPYIMTAQQIVYVFESASPADAAHAVELWMASLVTHAPTLAIATGGNDAALQDVFFSFSKTGWFEPAARLATLPGVDVAAENQKALKLAAQQGRLRVVQWLAKQPGIDVTGNDNKALVVAAKNGRVRVAQWLIEERDADGAARDNKPFIVAAGNGHLQLAQYLAGRPGVNVAAQDNLASVFAAKNGHLRVFQWLAQQRGVSLFAQNNAAPVEAARYGHTQVLEWLQGQERADFLDDLALDFEYISSLAPLSALQWIAERTAGISLESKIGAFKNAIMRGDVPVMQWLAKSQGVDVTGDGSFLIITAVFSGKLNVMQWLTAQPGVKVNTQNNLPVVSAARAGHLSIVQWLHTQPGVDVAVRDNIALILAADEGHLPVVQWLAAQPAVDCTAQNNEAVRKAARNGHIAVVQWFAAENVMHVDTALGMSVDKVETLITTLTEGAQRKFGLQLVGAIAGKFTDDPVPPEIVRSVQFLLRPEGATLLFREHDEEVLQTLSTLSAARFVRVEIRQIVTDALQGVLDALREETGEAPRKRAKKTLARLTELLKL